MRLIIILLTLLAWNAFAVNIQDNYLESFNIQLLNRINVVNYEISQADDEKSRQQLGEERQILIDTFLDRLKNGEFRTVSDIDREDIYHQYLLELYKAKQQDNDLDLLIAQMKIQILSMERNFETFLFAVYHYNHAFKTLQAYENLFIDFSEHMTFSARNYKTTYDVLMNKNDLTSQEKNFIRVYKNFEDRKEVYQDIFYQIASNTYQRLKTNNILTDFGIEKLITYINGSQKLNNFNKWTNKYFDITIGQLIIAFAFLFGIILLKKFIIDGLLYIIDFIIGQQKLNHTTSPKRFRQLIHQSFRLPLRYFTYTVAVDLFLRVLMIRMNNQEIVNYFVLAYILLLVWTLFRLINNFVVLYSDNMLERYPNVRGEMVNFFVNFSKIIVAIIGFIIILGYMGYDVTGLLASLGIGGLAVAFAGRETIANIFGSISLILDNTYSQGDWVVVNDSEGTIVDIGMRTTKIRTFDNAMISVPNATMASETIKNWSKRVLGRRIYMHVGLTYSSDPANIQQAVKDIRQMLIDHPDIADDRSDHNFVRTMKTRVVSENLEYGIEKTLLVYIDQLNHSSIDIMIYCFSKTVNWEGWLNVKQDVLLKIIDIIKQNNLEFAFDSRHIYLKNRKQSLVAADDEAPETISQNEQTEER